MEIYTIGYEGLNQKAFLAWLQRYEINVIADVRQLPLKIKNIFCIHRKIPGFFFANQIMVSITLS